MNTFATPRTRMEGCDPSGRVARDGRAPFWLAFAFALAAIALLTTGCNSVEAPQLGLVEGTVTLDGVPLPSVLVVFTPDGPGRSATATTDTAGHYSLSFLRDIPGANVGTHTVRITTSDGRRGSKEMLPRRYHRKTELMATVQPGSNTIDFALESK